VLDEYFFVASMQSHREYPNANSLPVQFALWMEKNSTRNEMAAAKKFPQEYFSQRVIANKVKQRREKQKF
jgi:hypothetical protein